MHAPLVLSLALHLAALGLPTWVPASPPPTTQPVQVRLELVPESKPVQAQPKPVAKSTTRSATPAPQPLLAGGGAMSEEADDVSAQATPAQARTHLADATSAAGGAQTSQAAGAWSEAAGGTQRSDSVQAGAGPARLREVAETRAAATAGGSSGGQAGSGEMAAGALRGEGRTASAVLARQPSAVAVAREIQGTPAQGAGEGASAARAGAATGAAHLRTATAGSVGAPEAGTAARASGVDHGATQRLTRAHAQAAVARMADAGSAGRQPAAATPGLPGAVASAESPALRHGGPERLAGGLAAIENGRALDPSALDSAPSNFVFRAALAGDGEACFGYSTALRRTGLQGLVVLRVRVDVAGRPQRIEIRNSSGVARLDAHAKDQAERCARFVVHNRKGQAVAATLDLPVRYRFNAD